MFLEQLYVSQYSDFTLLECPLGQIYFSFALLSSEVEVLISQCYSRDFQNSVLFHSFSLNLLWNNFLY